MPVAIPLAIAGSTLAGAAISSKASSSAAKTVQQGTDRAADLQNQQFQQTLALQMPGLNRANAAGDLYSQALGIPSRQPQYTGQSYAQPSMTGSGYTMPAYSGRQDGTYAQMQQLIDSGQIQGDPSPGMVGTGQYGQPQQVSEGAPMGGQAGGMDIPSMVRNTPGYQGQLDQGIKSIDRAAPLVGGMYSGRRMKALNDYGQQTFGSYYDRWMDRVAGVAGEERGIASGIAQAGQQNANNVGQLMMTGANSRANGALNSASAWTGALGTAAGMAGGYFR